MNEKYIRKLIRLVEESEIESLEVSSWGRKVRITQRLTGSSNGSGHAVSVVQPIVAPTQKEASSAPPPAPAPQAETPAAEDTGKLVPIKSPMVGTFYSAPSPDASAYVSLNEKISVGQVVCIVEAMKLMNEIESEVSGRVAKILAQNAQPVEFGQTLYLIDPDA
ncbi:MAG TPA: acetyl-CoA carboxylase biotin carboxyl carrier protein [candidate division Zixibacteria bacterium]|nr:acetyl-CoA carboxylase biotin carboxyl carrier protein [candidate division Zixibacteria bacterium]